MKKELNALTMQRRLRAERLIQRNPGTYTPTDTIPQAQSKPKKRRAAMVKTLAAAVAAGTMG